MHTHIENTPPGPRAQADRSAITGWGADLDHANRPAYPMERTPPRLHNLHWDQPSAQPVEVEVLVSTERPGITPVFGTTLPPRGLSGSLRRLAFKASENDLRRWLLLMLADRIDVVEGLLHDLARVHPRFDGLDAVEPADAGGGGVPDQGAQVADAVGVVDGAVLALVVGQVEVERILQRHHARHGGPDRQPARRPDRDDAGAGRRFPAGEGHDSVQPV